eukprot:m.473791 g.473791  ORF g.473791 m.473791 type:complete len:177 (+) comp57131_c0_seq2:1541-2071(+)
MVSLESAVVVANLAAGSVSLLLSLLSMLLTHLTLRVDRDPARLLRYRALFDALIGCLYIGTSIYFLLDSNTSDASRICEVIQFMQTFFETATSMWLVMIAIDLYRVMVSSINHSSFCHGACFRLLPYESLTKFVVTDKSFSCTQAQLQSVCVRGDALHSRPHSIELLLWQCSELSQ